MNNLFSKISNMNVNFEIYSNDSKAGLKCVNKKYQRDIQSNCSKDEIIDHLLSVSEEKYVVHKIFPFMFQETEYTNIVDRSNYIIFIKRNFLDVFISNTKANQIKQWLMVDTTDLSIHFDITEYSNDKQYYENWFKNIKSMCDISNKPFVIIDYDVIVSMNSEEEQINYCVEKIREITGDDFQIETTNLMFYNKPVFKQDTLGDYSKKLSNYSEVSDFIENRTNHILKF